jgi:hypothetical protein
MDQIFDFSAAPHLPVSLRTLTAAMSRPERILSTLTNATLSGCKIPVLERNGEACIEFANAA